MDIYGEGLPPYGNIRGARTPYPIDDLLEVPGYRGVLERPIAKFFELFHEKMEGVNLKIKVKKCSCSLEKGVHLHLIGGLCHPVLKGDQPQDIFNRTVNLTQYKGGRISSFVKQQLVHRAVRQKATYFLEHVKDVWKLETLRCAIALSMLAGTWPQPTTPTS
eukprot:scaffold210304_cov39-Tisochrysis_lutea.AAC.1